MLHFCTVFDKNYLHKGLCLHYSLHEQLQAKVALNRPFILHVLCLDEQTFKILKNIDYDNVYLYQLSMLEDYFPELQEAKNLPASNYGSQADNYIWRLTPFFVHHILTGGWIKPHEFLMYVDSDIYFYQSPELIFDVIKKSEKVMGIHTHRFGGPFQNTRDVGWFNVGVVIFKANAVGIELAKAWKDVTITNNHTYYEFYGTCGDQKYLDLLYALHRPYICVFDEEGDMYHLAPWNDVIENKELLFYHFSHFHADLTGNDFKDSHNGEWNPARDPRVRGLYQNYNQSIQTIDVLIQKHLA